MNSLFNAIAPTTNSVINDLSRLCQSDSAPSAFSAVESLPTQPLLRSKYVIINANGFDTAIIFPEFCQHNWAINLEARNPISAGFWLRRDDGTIAVFGESTSLNLKSRPEDAEIIRETLFMNGL